MAPFLELSEWRARRVAAVSWRPPCARVMQLPSVVSEKADRGIPKPPPLCEQSGRSNKLLRSVLSR